jgi:excisionase family DNA binding protein
MARGGRRPPRASQRNPSKPKEQRPHSIHLQLHRADTIPLSLAPSPFPFTLFHSHSLFGLRGERRCGINGSAIRENTQRPHHGGVRTATSEDFRPRRARGVATTKISRIPPCLKTARGPGGDGEPGSEHSSTSSTGGNLMTASLQTCNVAQSFERLLDLTEAAQLVHCHVKTLQRYARQGMIPGYKIHGRWYFRTSELDSWVRAQVKSVCHPCRSN